MRQTQSWKQHHLPILAMIVLHAHHLVQQQQKPSETPYTPADDAQQQYANGS